MSQQLLQLALTALSGGGVAAGLGGLVQWWRRRHRAPLDVAQLAQEVSARAVEHAREQLDAAYAETSALRAELAAARSEISRLTAEVAHLSAVLDRNGIPA